MRSRLILAVAVVGFLTGCVATGPGGKTSLIIIPTSQEVAIGRGMADEIAETEAILGDPEWQQYITEIGNRLVAVSDRSNLKYHFAVIESEQINAFAAPGGFIYFYTGLLKKMDNEAELAAVMAHEVSHVVARHGVKRLQAALGVSLAYQLATGGESSQVVEAAVGVGMGLVFSGYSRANELEADDYGMTYMIKAGYAPRGMIGMFEKLQAGGHSAHGFEKLMSSHPETVERIRRAEQRLAGLGGQLAPDLKLGTQRYQQMLERLPTTP